MNANLRWHETVEYTHELKDDTTAVAAIAPSIPTGIEPESAENHGIHWIPVGISAAVAVTGTVLAIVGNSNAKSAHDRKPSDAKEYKKNKNDIHSAQTLRTVGIVTAIVGAVGIGVSFAF